MLDIIYTKKEKIRVFLFSKLYKMMFKIFKSEMPYTKKKQVLLESESGVRNKAVLSITLNGIIHIIMHKSNRIHSFRTNNCHTASKFALQRRLINTVRTGHSR